MKEDGATAEKGFVGVDRVVSLLVEIGTESKFISYIIIRNTFMGRLSLVAITLATLLTILFPAYQGLQKPAFGLVAGFSMLGYWASSYSFLVPIRSLYGNLLTNNFSKWSADVERIDQQKFEQLSERVKVLGHYSGRAPILPLLRAIAINEIYKRVKPPYLELVEEEEHKKKLNFSRFTRLLALYIPCSKKADEAFVTINKINAIVYAKYEI